MTANEYQAVALRTANKALTNEELLLDGVLGLAGEAGECVDIMKKHLFQGHDLDKVHLMKEIGDCLWYAAVASHALGYTLGEVMAANKAKLEARYPDGFCEFRSRNRRAGDV